LRASGARSIQCRVCNGQTAHLRIMDHPTPGVFLAAPPHHTAYRRGRWPVRRPRVEAYAGEWLQLLIRWVHLITGIAWIGASFYFIWLDNSLLTTQLARDAGGGVGGRVG